jgi:hypothetical protein
MSDKPLAPKGPSDHQVVNEAYAELAARFAPMEGHHSIAKTDARITSPGTARPSKVTAGEASLAKAGVKPTSPARSANTVSSHRVKGGK